MLVTFRIQFLLKPEKFISKHGKRLQTCQVELHFSTFAFLQTREAGKNISFFPCLALTIRYSLVRKKYTLFILNQSALWL